MANRRSRTPDLFSDCSSADTSQQFGFSAQKWRNEDLPPHQVTSDEVYLREIASSSNTRNGSYEIKSKSTYAKSQGSRKGSLSAVTHGALEEEKDSDISSDDDDDDRDSLPTMNKSSRNVTAVDSSTDFSWLHSEPPTTEVQAGNDSNRGSEEPHKRVTALVTYSSKNRKQSLIKKTTQTLMESFCERIPEKKISANTVANTRPVATRNSDGGLAHQISVILDDTDEFLKSPEPKKKSTGNKKAESENAIRKKRPIVDISTPPIRQKQTKLSLDDTNGIWLGKTGKDEQQSEHYHRQSEDDEAPIVPYRADVFFEGTKDDKRTKKGSRARSKRRYANEEMEVYHMGYLGGKNYKEIDPFRDQTAKGEAERTRLEKEIQKLKEPHLLKADQVNYLIRKNLDNLRRIETGELPSWRHNLYTKPDAKRGEKKSLDLRVPIHFFKQEVVELTNDLMSHLVETRRTDYHMRVLFPEMLVMMYADVKGISRQKAEKEINRDWMNVWHNQMEWN